MNAWNGRTWGSRSPRPRRCWPAAGRAQGSPGGCPARSGALPDVEVVATDADAGVLKVRSRSDLGGHRHRPRLELGRGAHLHRPATATAPPSPGSMASRRRRPPSSPTRRQPARPRTTGRRPRPPQRRHHLARLRRWRRRGTPERSPRPRPMPRWWSGTPGPGPGDRRQWLPHRTLARRGARALRAPRRKRWRSRRGWRTAPRQRARRLRRRRDAQPEGMLIGTCPAPASSPAAATCRSPNVRVRSNGGWGLVVNRAPRCIDDSVIEGHAAARLTFIPARPFRPGQPTFHRGALGRRRRRRSSSTAAATLAVAPAGGRHAQAPPKKKNAGQLTLPGVSFDHRRGLLTATAGDRARPRCFPRRRCWSRPTDRAATDVHVRRNRRRWCDGDVRGPRSPVPAGISRPTMTFSFRLAQVVLRGCGPPPR